METHIFTRQSDLTSAEYLARRLGHKSDYARGISTHEEYITESESEQAVPLLTPQEVSELSDREILCLCRSYKPIRARRMDWREYEECKALSAIPAPKLPKLAAVPQILPLAPTHARTPLRVRVTSLPALRRQHHSTTALTRNPRQKEKARAE